MNLPLRGVAIYNPALLSKEELIAQFIARRPLLETILNDLRKQDRPDHRILIGPRGMGKTTLLRRIHFAVEDDPVLSSRWMALPFPEEQYNLTRLSDFYLNCIDALGDALVHLGRTGEAEGLDRLRDALPDGNEDVRAEGTLKLLLATADRLERRLILLIDNLEMVLDRLKTWEWNLRELLGHDARLCVIGASAFTPEQTYEYGKAFYEFFRIHELRPLNETEARQVLLHLADVRKAPQITKIVNEEPARVRTLLTLAGGNPRTLVQLYAVLAQSSEGDARSDLERLLDECTPIYKAKFEALSVQAQQIVDAVALHWHPATVADIAEITRLDPNIVSSQVNRLFKDGVIEAVQAVEGNRKTYQIAERFFNIWYLMRASRRVRQRLVWLVESLRLIYSQDELPVHARYRLSAAPPDGTGHRMRDAEYRMALAQAVEDRALKRALVSSALRSWADEDGLRDKTAELLELAPGDVETKPIADRHRAMAGLRKKILNARVRMKGWDAERFWELLGGADVPLREKLALVDALEETPARTLASRIKSLEERARTLKETMRSDEIVTTYQQAIREGHLEEIHDLEGAETAALVLACPELRTMAIAASLDRDLAPEPRRIRDLEGALEETPRLAFGWLSLARALERVSTGGMGQKEKTEAAYRRALDIDPRFVVAWRKYADWLVTPWGGSRFSAAEAALRSAIEVDPGDAWTWNGLGRVLFERDRSRSSEAASAFQHAIDLAPDRPEHWLASAFSLLETSRNREAEDACRKAITLRPGLPFAWGILGDILVASARHAEAGDAYRRALQLNIPWPWVGINLGLLLEQNLNEPEQAEVAYRGAIAGGDENVRSTGLRLIALNRYRRSIVDAETERVAREMVSLAPEDGAKLLLAAVLVRRGLWDEPARLAREVIVTKTIEERGETWNLAIPFFHEVVRERGAAAALQLLEDFGVAERWLPLRAALTAVRDGERALLAFAPEVRRPAEVLLGTFQGRAPRASSLDGAAGGPEPPRSAMIAPRALEVEDLTPAEPSAASMASTPARRPPRGPVKPGRTPRKLTRTPPHGA